MLHYGNHPNRPEIKPGELANYALVRGGSLPCRIVELREHPDVWRTRVVIRATADRPGYRRGEELLVTPLFVSRRDEA